MGVSPFNDPLLSPLLGDEEMAALFSPQEEMSAMLAFEAALASAQADQGVFASGAAETIAAAIATFKPDLDRLGAGTARDGVVVPELVRQLREHAGGEAASLVHLGATSQDVVDTSLALRLARAMDILEARLGRLDKDLAALETRDGAMTVMAHTRMQRAIEVPASRIINSWHKPLERCRDRAGSVRDTMAVVSFAGAAGTLDKLGDSGPAVRERLAGILGLGVPGGIPHNERDGQAVFAGWLAQVSGSCGKMGQDIALLAQNEVGTIRITAGGGSSAMPHKVNPVGAETLVALARFNATLVSGMHHAMVHEYERSGAAWTLEWMVLPQMVMATAASLSMAEKLLATIRFSKDGPAR